MVGGKKADSQIEKELQEINKKIEDLKYQFTLYFQGEIRVPPEKGRTELQKKVRNLLSQNQKSARVSLLIQNATSRFSTYNNMWMKRLNELETGISVIQRKKTAYMEDSKPKKKVPKPKNVEVSLNSEDSFDKFFDNYAGMVGKKSDNLDKEKVINSIKTKMITANVVDAKIKLAVENGKIKLKIKSAY